MLSPSSLTSKLTDYWIGSSDDSTPSQERRRREVSHREVVGLGVRRRKKGYVRHGTGAVTHDDVDWEE